MTGQTSLSRLRAVRLTQWYWKRAVVRWARKTRRQIGWGILARPLSCASDSQIDAALARRGIARDDLFRPSYAVAAHRGRLARMLAAFRIDVGRATADHWQDLKIADGRCRDCRDAGRCNRWLEWAWTTEFDTAPMAFCPNAGLWSAIAQEQAASGGPGDGSLSSRA